MRFRAALAPDRKSRQSYLRLEDNWMRLAERYQLAERISGYLEWQAQRIR